jgi:hypothetical protein
MPAEELRGKLSHEIEIPDAPRDVRLCVAGTDEDPKLGRLIGFLEDKLTFSISVITYRVHVLAGGQRVLMRELTESDLLVAAPQHEAPNTDDLALRIRSRPFDDELKIIFDAAVKHGLYPRAFRWSIMFTPPTARNRCLVTVATVPRPSGHLRIWVEPPAFAKFYPVDENEVRAELGEQGWREFGDGDAEMFAQGLDRLFAIIDRKSVAQDAR